MTVILHTSNRKQRFASLTYIRFNVIRHNHLQFTRYQQDLVYYPSNFQWFSLGDYYFTYIRMQKMLHDAFVLYRKWPTGDTEFESNFFFLYFQLLSMTNISLGNRQISLKLIRKLLNINRLLHIFSSPLLK